jgi:hypothetical protein
MSITNRKLTSLTTLVVALFTGLVATGLGASPLQPGGRTAHSVEALALEWFEFMRTGQIDRTQLTPDYSAQLTEAAVQSMSQYLKEYKYGASPTGAEVLQTRRIGEQTFYVVKLVFPRGDAASLLLGFNLGGKITGISLMSMAGD